MRAPVDAGLREGAVEQLAGRADERAAGEILLVARLLADEHDARVERAFAEHGLGGVLVEMAAGAAFRLGEQRLPGGERIAARLQRALGRVGGREAGLFGGADSGPRHVRPAQRGRPELSPDRGAARLPGHALEALDQGMGIVERVGAGAQLDQQGVEQGEALGIVVADDRLGQGEEGARHREGGAVGRPGRRGGGEQVVAGIAHRPFDLGRRARLRAPARAPPRASRHNPARRRG